MFKDRLILSASALAILAAMPRVTAAQLAGTTILTPYAGAYAPTNDLATGRFVGKQKAAFVYGISGSAWMTDRFGLEAGAAYALSDVTGSVTTLSQSRASGAHVWLGSVKLMTQLLPPTSRYNLRLGLGPAVISHGGDAYQADSKGEITGLTDVGAAMSLCTRLPLTSSVSLRLRAENYLYQARLRYEDRIVRSNNISFDSKVQNDLMFSVGLQLMSHDNR
jgi:hypothetical protein